MAPPVFRPRATSILRTSLALAVLTPALVLVLLWVWARSPEARNEIVSQPIQFDHRHHVGDDGIDCRYCHSTVERSPSAGYPATSVCMNCHVQIWNHSGITEPIRARYFENRPIEWQRVYRVPDYVFFNHAIHVNKGVGCIECHGRVDLMPAIRREVSMNMSWCLDCHRHPESRLRPLDEITSMRWRPPKGEEGQRLGEELRKQYHVNPPTDCYACHR